MARGGAPAGDCARFIKQLLDIRAQTIGESEPEGASLGDDAVTVKPPHYLRGFGNFALAHGRTRL